MIWLDEASCPKQTYSPPELFYVTMGEMLRKAFVFNPITTCPYSLAGTHLCNHRIRYSYRFSNIHYICARSPSILEPYDVSDWLQETRTCPWILIDFFCMESSVVKKSLTFTRWSPCNCMTSPISSSLTIVPLQAKSFFRALSILFWSYSRGRPWTVVNVFLPFLCWIRMSNEHQWQSDWWLVLRI